MRIIFVILIFHQLLANEQVPYAPLINHNYESPRATSFTPIIGGKENKQIAQIKFVGIKDESRTIGLITLETDEISTPLYTISFYPDKNMQQIRPHLESPAQIDSAVITINDYTFITIAAPRRFKKDEETLFENTTQQAFFILYDPTHKDVFLNPKGDALKTLMNEFTPFNKYKYHKNLMTPNKTVKENGSH